MHYCTTAPALYTLKPVPFGVDSFFDMDRQIVMSSAMHE